MIQLLADFKSAVTAGKNDAAEAVLGQLKSLLLDMNSLPPMCMESPTAAQEKQIAREVYEYAALLAINQEDKDAFQRCISSLRPYYTTMNRCTCYFFVYNIFDICIIYIF